MEIKDQKKAIRRAVSLLKKEVTVDEKNKFSDLITTRLEELPEFRNSNTILLYYALSDEAQTEKFINKWASQKRIVLPVVDGDFLVLKEYRSDMIEVGYQSILEPQGTVTVMPSEIELAVIPGVAFDEKCNRLGRGKGFYDRLLPDINCPVIGLGYTFQIVESIPVEHFDKSIDMVITDSQIFTTTK